MTEDRAERESADLLAVIGQVDPPDPSAMQNAREVLWSAVADDMLSAGAAGGAERMRARGTDRSEQPARRRRTDPGS